MAERSDLRDRLIKDRSLLPEVTEEFLRHSAPTLGRARTVSRDADLHGQSLRAGDRATLMWGPANRDPAVFPNPAEIDLDRPNKRHLAFGVGRHRCLRSNLARMMFRVMIDEILTRLPDCELDCAPIPLRRRRRGLCHLQHAHSFQSRTVPGAGTTAVGP
ncbi:cytochrome P450 [Mycobacterium sp. MUNTM1]